MKIFYNNGENYVWERINGIDKDRWEFILNDSYGCEIRVPFGKARSVKNDIRKRHIWCASCGEMIKVNTGEDEVEAIRRHFRERESNTNCLKCKYFGLSNALQTKRTVKMLPDGTVSEIVKNIGAPRCGKSYRSISPETAKDNGACQFYSCRRIGRYESFAETAYIKYPKMLETILTISALNGSKKWKFHRYDGNEIEYVYSNVSAIVDKNGEFKCFRIVRRSMGMLMFFYSPEYDMFFSVDRGWRKIRTLDTDQLKIWLRGGREDKVIAEIKSLYSK